MRFLFNPETGTRCIVALKIGKNCTFLLKKLSGSFNDVPDKDITL